MTDQEIYALMAKTPKIRAVQIADALDVDLEDVNEKLRFLVAMGHVVPGRGFSPNGHTVQIYDLSEQFKGSPEGVALLGTVESAATDQPAMPAEAPAVAPALSAVLDAEIEAISDESGRTARALAYIETHGSATDAQLRALMGLRDSQYPSAYLSMAAQAGKVVKVGHEWKIGSGHPPQPLKRQPAFGTPLGLPGASPFDVPAPPPPAPKAKRQAAKSVSTDAPEPVPAQSSSPLRCGVWHDGTCELRRGGATTELTQAEAMVVRDFLNRVLPAELTT